MDWQKQVLGPLVTLVKTFLAAALGQVIAYGVGVLDYGAAEWKAAAAAGIAAVILTAYQWLTPAKFGGTDKYGIGSG
jgi:hypothetical protein